MTSLEIKKVDIKSAIKVTMYFLIFLAALMVVIGLIMAVIGIAIRQSSMMWMGLLFAVGYTLFLLVLYPIITALTTLIYNFFAGRYGGLEIDVKLGEEG